MIELKPLFLQKPRLTLAVAESLTCGHVQARVGAISGASEFFLGGITAYTLDQKVAHLGVNRAAAKRVDCVSAAVAREMARGACQLFGSDLGLATTGYAEPSAKAGVAAASMRLTRLSIGLASTSQWRNVTASAVAKAKAHGTGKKGGAGKKKRA